jgi:hypothetical protein
MMARGLLNTHYAKKDALVVHKTYIHILIARNAKKLIALQICDAKYCDTAKFSPNTYPPHLKWFV